MCNLILEFHDGLEINFQQPNSTSPPFAPKPVITNPECRETFSYRESRNIELDTYKLLLSTICCSLLMCFLPSRVSFYFPLSDIGLYIKIT